MVMARAKMIGAWLPSALLAATEEDESTPPALSICIQPKRRVSADHAAGLEVIWFFSAARYACLPH